MKLDKILVLFKPLKQWEPCEICGSYCWGKCSPVINDFPE